MCFTSWVHVIKIIQKIQIIQTGKIRPLPKGVRITGVGLYMFYCSVLLSLHAA